MFDRSFFRVLEFRDWFLGKTVGFVSAGIEPLVNPVGRWLVEF